MKSVPHNIGTVADRRSLDDIDSLLDELSRLARSETIADSFYAQLLETATVAIGAVAAAVWLPVPGHKLAPLRKFRLETEYDESRHRAVETESVRYGALMTTGLAASFPAEPNRGVSCAVLACSLKDSNGTKGVLTIYLPAETPALAREKLLDFAQAVAGIALEHELSRQVAQVEETVRLAQQVERFSLRVHQHWEPTDTAYELANEGRRLIGCDRLTVLVRDGGGWRVAAVSGIDQVINRSSEVRRLQALVGSVVQSGQPLIYHGASDELPPQVESALAQYLDGAAARELVVAPALPPPTSESPTSHPCQVALVAEQFIGRLPLEWIARIETVAEHAAVALPRARAFRRIPFPFRPSPVSLTSTWPLSTRGTAALSILLATAAMGLVLTIAKTEFRMVAHGRLQPLVREWVFAPSDGVVEELAVDHGQLVSKGSRLLTLRSTELDLEIQQVEGQLDSARQESALLDTARLQQAAENSSANVEASDLMSQQLTVTERIRNLDSQLRILRAKKASLVVASPIQGTVLNWKPAEYLRSRPVERGTALLEIGDLNGQWVVELDVNDRRAGHVLKALETQPEDVAVSFVVATNPEQRYAGKIVRTAETTHLDENGESAVRMEVAIDKSKVSELRHGAAIIAKIDCGRRSLGYVWLHELLEELERRFF